jgi:hypothetical protein
MFHVRVGSCTVGLVYVCERDAHARTHARATPPAAQGGAHALARSGKGVADRTAVSFARFAPDDCVQYLCVTVYAIAQYRSTLTIV